MDVKNFTLAEFTHSDTAIAEGIDNRLPAELRGNATATLQMMQGIRDKLSLLAGKDIPISIRSGYRSAKLNRAVGGGMVSDHLQANAVDFLAPTFGHPLRICQALAPMVSMLGIGQLIYERPRGVERAWVHVSTVVPKNPVNRIITITPKGALPGIVA